MSEKIKDVEKMIIKVMKKKDLGRNAAIDYMLIIATGRLAALWRYDESLPEGKLNKGVLTLVGRKKRAPKTARIAALSELVKVAEKVAKPKPKRARKPKVVKEIVVEEEAAQ